MRWRTQPKLEGVTNGRRKLLYRSVADSLRQQLADGGLSDGAKVPSLRALAKQYNVSTITVRQALQTLEREGRLHCIPGVGVFVRPTIPGRTVVETMTVAFATIEIDTAFTSRIAHGIEEACQERGWCMQLLNAQGDTHLEARNLSRLAKSGVSGAIILPVSDAENLEALVELKICGFPFVLVDLSVPGLKVDMVASNHEKGAYAATEYFLNRGHRRVLMVTQFPKLSSVGARIRGYEQALVDHGIEPLRDWKIWMDNSITRRGGMEGRRWLGGCEATLPALPKFDPPIAILAHNAYSGWGVFEACRKTGLRIPEDVSVISFDDAEFTRALNPPMTTVAQRNSEIGRTAVEVLERRIASGTTEDPRQTLLDVDIIERGSVATVGGQ
jgi:GntR family transcriptional regulator, arabinose operon transcriptional repressor